MGPPVDPGPGRDGHFDVATQTADNGAHPVPGMNLTRDEVRERAAGVEVISYEVDLDLTGGAETFRSRTVVRFTSRAPYAATFIDAVTVQVHAVRLNGDDLDVDAVVDGVSIRLTDLQPENVLEVDAQFAYSHTGEGLHRFVDPVDGEVYLYTQFEVSDARRVFAVFEQPDLKATFAFTVTAPQHWKVVSNAPTPPATPVGDGCARWVFGPTERMSSYITALVAGPYHEVRSQVSSRDGRVIPLGVFCRASLAEHLDAEEIVEVTRAGFAFFEELFDFPYPFRKYDQLFVPEYNAGAMENAGCVTILEDYVFRSRVPEAAYERRAETVLHELAHMWFGDLVTMRWWDDLWLNESFASYAAVLCQVEATRWTQAWTTFASTEKSWAYRQDQLSTTHPISADIRDLEDVEVNFDGITYAKGASVLKQLAAWVGREAFRDGLRAYFRRYAWGNTTLADLLSELEATSGRDLSAWSKQWLETAGVTTLRAEFDTDDAGRFTSFALTQQAPEEHPTLRSHRLAVGLYDLAEGRLRRRRRVELDVVGPRTEVPDLVGEQGADLMLVNDDDLAYAKVRLDPRSLQTLMGSIGTIESSLARALCWTAAWDMTRDGELAARDFVALVLGGIGAESGSTVTQTLLRQLHTTLTLYVAQQARPAELARAGDALLELARASEAGSDHQLQFVRALAGVAVTDEQLDVLAGLLDGTVELAGLAIDTDLRWSLLAALVAHGRAGAAEVDAELDRDDTAAGRRLAAGVRAATPSEEAKALAWAQVVEHDDLPNATQAAIIGGFWQPGQLDLLRDYAPRYFDAIRQVYASRSNEIAQQIVIGLFPTLLADQPTLEMANEWLQFNLDAPAALRRMVTESRDGLARALRCQAVDAG